MLQAAPEKVATIPAPALGLHSPPFAVSISARAGNNLSASEEICSLSKGMGLPDVCSHDSERCDSACLG